MKLILLILILIITLSDSRRKRKTLLKSNDLEQEKQEFTNFINQFELDNSKSIWEDDKKEIKLNSNIEDAKFKFPILKNLNWVHIKKYFNKPENHEIMKKFLVLRYEDLKLMLKKALTKSPFSSCDSNPNMDIVGTLKNFYISCVKYRRDADSEEIQGKVVFSPSGSGTFTSDIDVSLEFQIFNKENYSLQLGFKIGGEIIRNYNSIFIEEHGVSSAQAYDVNLYYLNFADMLEMIWKLKKESYPHYLKFLYANRLSALLLVYNDSYNLAVKKEGETFIRYMGLNLSEINQKIGNVYDKSNSDDPAFICGKLMIEEKSAIFKDRSHDPVERNDKMVQHLIKAAQNTDTDYLFSLCNILASNFYALEAYVPVGSIIDIKLLQESITQADLNPYPGMYDDNNKVDGILMNFAYGIEHYYEAYGESSAIKNFSKYMARALRLAKSIDDNRHRACWMDAYRNILADKFSKYVISDDDKQELLKGEVLSLISDITNAISKEKINNNKVNNKKNEKILEFIRSGYGCINHYGFDIDSSRVGKLRR